MRAIWLLTSRLCGLVLLLLLASCGSNTSPRDGGVADGGVVDGGVVDGGVADAGLADAGVADGGLADAGLGDGGPGGGDGGRRDGGAAPSDGGVTPLDGGLCDGDGGVPDGGGPLAMFAVCACSAECESGLCFNFRDRGNFCTKLCTATSDCPLPSPGCNARGVCRLP